MEQSLIRFVNVCKSFKNNHVLKNLTFEIPRGKISFIIGKSGEGKSVTIKHITGLLHPSEGEIWIHDRPMHKATEKEWNLQRRKLGYLFQDGALFDSLTVKENITFPLDYSETKFSPQEIHQCAEEMVAKLGLEKQINVFPYRLSAAEKKKVGLARALALNPEILLYDEPTTGMDPFAADFIDNLILKTQKDHPHLTSIVISHDIKSTLSMADKIFLLKDGVIHFSGSPKDFVHSKDSFVQ